MRRGKTYAGLSDSYKFELDRLWYAAVLKIVLEDETIYELPPTASLAREMLPSPLSAS